MEYEIETHPLLSIVIATRNRIPYALSAIQSILEIPDSRLELVIQDSSDSRELEIYIHANIQDSRLRYRYTPPPFSMIDNFNAAVELATGEYLCVIGDDDGVNPEIIEAAEWAKANDCDALTTRILCGYLWENTGISSTLFTKVEGKTLTIKCFSGNLFCVDVCQEVKRLLQNGGVNYLSFHLPKLYHGIVRRRCLDDIRGKIGTYFKGLSPDIFAVLSISEVAERVMFIDYPLTIPGVCPGSGSTYKNLGKFSGRLEDSFLFRDRSDYNWCELVPRINSPETIWVDSGVVALRAMGRDDLVQKLNLPMLAAYCIGANRGVIRPVLRDLFKGMQLRRKSKALGVVQIAWNLLNGPGLGWGQRVWNRLLIIMGIRTIRRIDSLDNMVEATHALTHYLEENGYSFADCIERHKKNTEL